MKKNKKIVGIIDYGMGNIRSIENCLTYLKFNYKIISHPDDNFYSHIIIPGVGAFKKAISNLKKKKLFNFIIDHAKKKKTNILGICLGMQLMTSSSDEDGYSKGFCFFSNKTKKIPPSKKLKFPHVGYNNINIKKKSKIFNNIDSDPDFYFDHSFAVKMSQNNDISSTCYHSSEFVSSLEKDNIYGVQFHPEKSQSNGIKLFNNFINLKC